MSKIHLSKIHPGTERKRDMGFQTSKTLTFFLEGAQYFGTLYVHFKLRFKRALKLTEVYSSCKDSTSYLISKETMKTRGITGSLKINLDLCLKIRAIHPSSVRSGASDLAPYTQCSIVTLHKLQVSPVSHGRAAGSIPWGLDQAQHSPQVSGP